MRRALAVAFVVLAACDANPSPPIAPAPRRLTVAFSGEDDGRLEPCACSPAMLGGLARRKARIDASREDGVPMFVVSGGGIAEGSESYDSHSFAAFLEAFEAIGVDAFAPSSGDYEAPSVLTFTSIDPPPVVVGSFPVEFVRDGAKVAVAAVRENAFMESAKQARRQADSALPLVLLTELRAEPARELARELTGPTLVVYFDDNTDPRDDDATPGAVALAPYPAHGKYVGFAHLSGDGDAATWTVEYRPVVRELPEDASVKLAHAAMLSQMRNAGLIAKESANPRFLVGGGSAPEGAYAGSQSCSECHPEAVRVQPTTRHASAMATLAKTGDDADPGCVKCHVVGYGTGRGFTSLETTPSLSNVACEACHGPRAEHVEARRAGRVDARPAAKAATACAACHDAEHDPGFDFTKAWPKIAHGGK